MFLTTGVAGISWISGHNTARSATHILTELCKPCEQLGIKLGIQPPFLIPVKSRSRRSVASHRSLSLSLFCCAPTFTQRSLSRRGLLMELFRGKSLLSSCPRDVYFYRRASSRGDGLLQTWIRFILFLSVSKETSQRISCAMFQQSRLYLKQPQRSDCCTRHE